MTAGNAYAVRINENNFQAIASEMPGFDLESTVQWLEDNGQGYFLRDPESMNDCEYFVDEVFMQLYAFNDRDVNAVFRRVHRL